MNSKGSAADNTLQPAASPRVARKYNTRREGILRAAAGIFAEMGYHRTSLEVVADRFDLTRASLYHYFSSKDALLLACLEFGAQEAIERLTQAEAATRDDTAEERLRALIRTQLEITCRDAPEVSRLFLSTMDWPDSFRAHVKKLRKQHDAFFSDEIQSGIQKGEFNCPDAAVAIHCLHGAMNYAPMWLKPTRRTFDHDLDALIDTLVRLVLPGTDR